MSAHTPAPWSASCLPNGTEWTVSFEGGDMLADLTGCPNEAANARLIAAAPELLAFAERVANLPEFGHYIALIDAARELIERATGGAT